MRIRKKIIITGKAGVLSSLIAARFECSDIYNVDKISLRTNNWHEYSFADVEIVIHVAGVTPDKVNNVTDYYNINTVLTEELALKAKKSGVRHFIYLSSMAVYGILQSMDPLQGTITANTKCVPQNDYGKSKLLAENAINDLRNDNFHVTIVRVPSIWGPEQTLYLDQFNNLANKLPFIPDAFPNHYKSAICVDNLCELLFLIVENHQYGTICPDDGQFAAVDYCCMLQPNKNRSRIAGKLIELLLKNNQRILNYYGTICYAPELSNVFEGRYRIANVKKRITDLFSS